MHYRFWLKTSILYAVIAFGFSMLSLSFAETCNDCEKEVPNMLESDLAIHMIGHSIFGMLVALPIWRIKYIIASGLFVISLDFDHVLRYILGIFEESIIFGDIGFDIISRTGHSAVFGVLVAVLLMLAYGRKDYFLGAVSFAAVFGHMAFDTFTGSGVFPLFMPFTDEIFYFNQDFWVFIFLAGLSITFATKVIIRKKEQIEKQIDINNGKIIE